MKTCKMGCGKMKAGGPVKKVKKMALGGSATNKLNNPRPATKPQRGGSNVKMGIYGVPNAGPTGPNIQGVNTMKKGGAIKMKKYQDGGASSKFGIKSYNYMDTEKGGPANSSSKKLEGVKYGEGNKRKYIDLDVNKGTMTKTKFDKNNEAVTKVKNIGAKKVANKISKITSQKIGGAVKMKTGGSTKKK